MKIGFFTDVYAPQIDGVVRSIKLYKEALEKLGHEVFIFAPKGLKKSSIFDFISKEEKMFLDFMQLIHYLYPGIL